MGKDPTGRRERAFWLGPGRRRCFLLATTMLSGLAVPALAQTLPTGGNYVAGSGSIGTAGSGMTINQATSRGIINWQGFSIGSANSVQINNGSGATLNRVTGGNLSTISGELGATGSVYLINPNGVVVGPGGKVLTGGSFVASTRDVPNSQFMGGGTLTFSGTSNGTVTNEGSITSQNGDVVLIGQSATNTGTISAPNGAAALAAGNQVVLQPQNGPSGIYVAPDVTATGNASNSGTIKAAAAALASAGGNVYALAGNRGGMIQATGTKAVAGQVWLTAPNGTVEVSGTVTATNADGTGGQIVADGKATTLDSTAQLNASGTTGGSVLVGIEPGKQNEAATTAIASGAQILATGAGTAGGHIETSGQSLSLGSATIDAGVGGSWVIDPYDLTINKAAATTIDGTLNSGTGVDLYTTASGTSAPPGQQTRGPGDINIDYAISWNSSAMLTLDAYHSVNVNASITASGPGVLDITYNDGGSGGGLNFGLLGDIQFTTPDEGALSINGNNYHLIWTIGGSGQYDLSSLNDAPNGTYYALADSVPDAGTFSAPPVGYFAGTFNGLGNKISNLTITNSSGYFVGLFGEIQSGGVVENLGLVDETVTVTTGSPSYADVGGLVGENEGTISNSFVTGSISDSVNYSRIGGLAGENAGGALITGSSANVTVANTGGTGPGGTTNFVGGLVGENDGTISYSSASGSVSGVDYNSIGGLVGENTGTITGSSATASVMDTSTDCTSYVCSDVGGLVGQNQLDATITSSFASGKVTAGDDSAVGGLVGWNSGTISFSSAFGPVIDTVDDSNILSDVGGLAGDNTGMISGSLAFGSVTGGTVSNIGGLVGYNEGGTIGFSSEIGTVSGSDYSNVGGLVGLNGTGSSISNSSATGKVTDTSSASGDCQANVECVDIGGLVGQNQSGARITGSSAIGLVTSGQDSIVGGLVGYNDGTISGVLVFGTVKSSSNFDAGGLVGWNDTDGSISNAVAYGLVANTSGYAWVGGLVGGNYGTITNTSAYENVSSTGLGDVGGLVGYNYTNSEITNSSAIGTVTDTDTVSSNSLDVGGLVGLNYGSIKNDVAFVTVTGGSGSDLGEANVGGLVGENNGGSITDGFAYGNVSGGTYSEVGGLVGYNYAPYGGGTITGSFAYGNVAGGAYSYVGGLVGWNSLGSISNSSATGNVKDTGDDATLGGLVGVNNSGTIDSSFAKGKVTGSGADSDVGGLVGENDSTITHSYATGAVMDTATGSDVGGLVGNNVGSDAVVTNSYAKGDVTGSLNVGGLVGNNSGEITSTGTSYPYLTYASGTVIGGTGSNVGGLVGYNTGTISYADATGNVMGSSSADGGLVGQNSGGMIEYVRAYGAVTDNGDGANVGGLVGANLNDGSITNASAYGNVTGNGNDADVGGLVGNNNGSSIDESTAYGTVTGTGSPANVGGLVGFNYGTITDSNYAGPANGVSGVYNVGGLVGYNSAPYSDITGSSSTSSLPLIGGGNTGP